MNSRYALFITGPPASGKSVVAEFLAESLPGFVLLQKDVLKEALFESGITVDSRRLSDSATSLLWTLVSKSPRVILDSNFRTRDPWERKRFAALRAEKLEVHCGCPMEVATRRFAARAAERHPAHSVKELSPKVYEESEVPFGLGPLVQLDTTGSVDLPRLLQQVRLHWPDVSFKAN